MVPQSLQLHGFIDLHSVARCFKMATYSLTVSSVFSHGCQVHTLQLMLILGVSIVVEDTRQYFCMSSRFSYETWSH